MTETLVQAYLPLLLWPGIGIILFRFLPDAFPRWLGRSLYWVGIPLEIGVLARQSNLSEHVGLVPGFTVGALIAGLILGGLSLQAVKQRSSQSAIAQDDCASSPAGSQEENQAPPSLWSERSRQGSFILSSMIGNTGFVGLAIAPVFIDDSYLSWVVFYSVAHNVIGTYGLGVYVASYFGRAEPTNRWWTQMRDVFTVPSLWAFVLGYLSRPFHLNPIVESLLHRSLWLIIPAALFLMGMRISQLQGWKSIQRAIVPAVLKVVVLPLLVGLTAGLMGLSANPRLAMVLMSGMPTAFAGLILAEEYELDRDLIASSIVLTTGLLLLTIPLWLVLFGERAFILSRIQIG